MAEPLRQPEGSEESITVTRWWTDVLRRRLQESYARERELERQLRMAKQGPEQRFGRVA